MPKYRADFHTHSVLSHDGGIKLEQYEKILDDGILDFVAITDHNEIDFALQANDKLGNRIIVGEEIKTTEGEIIGLFLKQKIRSQLTPGETIREIKLQDGIVYIPHPNIPFISSIKSDKLKEIVKNVDIIEFFNAKNIFTQLINNIAKLADELDVVKAVGSDAHSFSELGKTYNIVTDKITQNNLVELLNIAEYSKSYIRPLHMLNPKLNKLKKLINV